MPRWMLLLLATISIAAVEPHDVGPGFIVPPDGFFVVEMQGIDSNPGAYVYLPDRDPILLVTEEEAKSLEAFRVRYDHGGLSGRYVDPEAEGVLKTVNHGYVIGLKVDDGEARASIPLYHLNFKCDYDTAEELALFVLLVSSFSPKGS